MCYTGSQKGSDMIDVLKQSQMKIADLCRRYEVVFLAVFGSALRDDYEAGRSDVDFVVRFSPDLVNGRARHYFAFEAALKEILGVKHIDLIEAEAMSNPFFVDEVNATQRVLYAA
jgi:predicted nucleotidyltransferase